ncbi:hypothetical protein CV102_07040 [Natronococcus pandeyae]|uniref:Uncharacterized protein n=1 Tax=Natronococcus pandeyae TaxID=2055836 RepID=A0A8J8Q5R0_9EURY|nr:hypothetical protein [Natronococcus pandeyae]TYL39043.1 hypothetical protein CV102_07040 [Natronococcus pandeyae]
MFSQVEFAKRDGRNLLIVLAIMIPILFLVADGALGARVVAAVVGGVLTMITFLVVTVTINRFGPDY